MFAGAVVVMGVSSCGKTSVGEALAARLGAGFVEGDKLHPQSNIQKMSSGTALDDEDRWPWLQAVGEALRGSTARVASCSALKRAYRSFIAEAAQRPVYYVFLHGERELLAKRIAARKNHFMPASLLESQLAALELPTAEERARQFDISLPVARIAEEAQQWLLQQETP